MKIADKKVLKSLAFFFFCKHRVDHPFNFPFLFLLSIFLAELIIELFPPLKHTAMRCDVRKVFGNNLMTSVNKKLTGHLDREST